ncbi:hypothetical protein RMONA_05715 [Rickettsia monacensis]|uniref:Uncharacterized protein n=1 Tax=Rickettsia monacensis TaxID=109232 RepID=A0A0B7J0C4_9RICK|nr:hypothetical protein RMONA_05715 [Rickettsia monacensis]
MDLSSKIFNLKKEQNSKTFLNNSSESHFSFKNIQYKTIIDKNIEWVIFGTGFNKNIILLPPLNTFKYTFSCLDTAN